MTKNEKCQKMTKFDRVGKIPNNTLLYGAKAFFTEVVSPFGASFLYEISSCVNLNVAMILLIPIVTRIVVTPAVWQSKVNFPDCCPRAS